MKNKKVWKTARKSTGRKLLTAVWYILKEKELYHGSWSFTGKEQPSRKSRFQNPLIKETGVSIISYRYEPFELLKVDYRNRPLNKNVVMNLSDEVLKIT